MGAKLGKRKERFRPLIDIHRATRTILISRSAPAVVADAVSEVKSGEIIKVLVFGAAAGSSLTG
jgi:hypothetical protein